MKRATLTTLLLLGCSNAPTTPQSSVPGDVHFTMSAKVAAGQELFDCKFVTMPAGQSFVVAAAHHYTPGSHHMLLYRTDEKTIPPGGGDVQDCYEGPNGSLMGHVRGVVYGSQVATASFTMPSGVAFDMTSQEVLLLQVHYLNATTAPITADVDVGLTTTHDPTKVQNKAGNLFYYDPFIDVPPASQATAGARCTLSQPITLVNVFPHFHARGYGYQAYLDLPGQAPAATPFYTSTDWEHPAAYTGAPLALPAGAAIRWTCDYQNQGAMEYFQGPSAANNEMCMFTGLYYPAVDDSFEQCLTAMNGFGVGTQTCAQATTCVQQCPSYTPSGPGDISPCVQKCMVGTCPSGSDALTAQLVCLQANCASCAGAACTQCALAHCAAELSACQSAACN